MANYSLQSLPPDQYNINFVSGGYSSRTLGLTIRSDIQSVLQVALSKLAGTVSGTLFTQAGIAIAGGTVRIYTDSTIVGFITTDQNGFFTFPSISPGTYSAIGTALGFQNKLLGAIVNPGLTTAVDFRLVPNPGRLTGTVTSTSNQPIPGAVITVRADNAQGPVVFKAIADSDGRYLVPNVAAPGNYTFVAAAPGFQSNFCGTSIESDITKNCDIILEPNPGTVTGLITNAQSGEALTAEAIEVRILNLFGVIVGSVFTDQSGRYLTPGLAPGSYGIVVTNSGFQTGIASAIVKSDEPLSVDIALLPEPGSLNGFIADAITALPIPGANVQVLAEDGTLIGRSITDLQGGFLVTGLPPGNYTVVAAASLYRTGLNGAVVLSNISTTVPLALTANPGSIRGNIEPSVFGIVIQLYNANHTFIATVASNPQEGFLFPNLAPGNYSLSAIAPGFAEGRTGVRVTAEKETSAFITMLPNPATITGTITGEDTEPIVNATVRVTDINDSLLGIGSTNAFGNYSIGNLRPGNQAVMVSAPRFGNINGGITLAPGGTVTGVNFALTPNPGSITGQIMNLSTGEVISGASVVLRASDVTGLQVKNTTSSPFGNFVLSDLAPGPYVLLAAAEGFASHQIGVVVLSEQSVRADVSLDLTLGNVNGTVTTDTFAPISVNVQIKVLTRAGLIITTLIANQDGTFTLDNLLPGNYILSASADGFITTVTSVQVIGGQNAQAVIRLPASPASINGRVLNTVTRIGLQGSLVTVKNTVGIILGRGFSDSSGFFAIEGLPSGSLYLTALSDKFGASSIGVLMTAGNTTTTELELTPNPGFISGFVTSFPDGSPISGAAIQIINESKGIVTTVLSNNQGFYLSPGLTPGNYTTVAQANDFSSERGGFLILSDQTVSTSFTLTSLPAQISGTVSQLESNLPLIGATIELREANTFGDPLIRAITGANGSYVLDGIPLGNYTLTGQLTGYQSMITSTAVTQAGQRQAINFELQLNPASIVIIPTDSTGRPVSGATVRVVDTTSVTVQEGQSDARGVFLATGLSQEEYTVVSTASVLANGDEELFLTNSVQKQITVVLPSNPGQVTGQVLEEQSIRPIAGAIVQVLSLNLIPIFVSASDGTGNYTIKGLDGGSFIVAVSARSFGSDSRAFNITTGGTAEVNLSLSPVPGNLAGTVRDERLVPIYRVLVQVFNASDLLLRQVITNFTGQYGVSGLDPGNYRVQFAYPGKQTQQRTPLIVSFETTILDVIMPDEQEE
ncbi:MSCRAMM family protein [Cohnella lupini]|uniref:Carboxypeptidase family protein n=1 Tax=Cohnella lupini TaxID=1294267 RepID=A0A3D9IXA0_9BACL|nr:carboxypeptidase regulatory-like domain-containing protein [Cohnella lupini]RED66237.1 carboxypeptidase family protein [Cohnella lupini]